MATKAKNPLVNVPFENIIGGPLKAAIKAQALMADTTIAFIKEVGFSQSDSTSESVEVKCVEFFYEKQTLEGKPSKERIKVPILTIVPIPSLKIEDVIINFGSKISEINLSSDFVSSTTSGKISASGNAFFLTGSASMQASLSHSKTTKNYQASKYGVDTTIHVQVRATGQETPIGLRRVLEILTGETLGESPKQRQSLQTPADFNFGSNTSTQDKTMDIGSNIFNQDNAMSSGAGENNGMGMSSNGEDSKTPANANTITNDDNSGSPMIAERQFTGAVTNNILITDSVGYKGKNNLADVQKIAKRLYELNFYKPSKDGKSDFDSTTLTEDECPSDLGEAIKVFQAATKPQGTFSGIDGKVDPGYSTIKKLNSYSAPSWVHFQTMIEKKQIANKIYCVTDSINKNWCTSWTAEFLLKLADDWKDWFDDYKNDYDDYKNGKKEGPTEEFADFLITKLNEEDLIKVLCLKINSLSDPCGGPRKSGEGKTIGSTHQSGINIDFRIFTKDGNAGIWTENNRYLRKLQEKFFKILKKTEAKVNSVTIKCDYGSRKPVFNDTELKKQNLCRSLGGHDNHVHTKIIPITNNWWTISPAQQTTSDSSTTQNTQQTPQPNSQEVLEDQNPVNNEIKSQNNVDTQNKQKSENYYKTIQLALTGFGAGVPDGIDGQKTQSAISLFKKKIVNNNTNSSIESSIIKFLKDNIPSKFSRSSINDYHCPCDKCRGFGNGQYKEEYRDNNKIEAYHKYEYPGIHIATFCAVAYINYYVKTKFKTTDNMVITSGYRCHEDNKKKGRSSTNHMGKAIDATIPGAPARDQKSSAEFYHNIQLSLVKSSPAAFQIRWTNPNQVSFEPAKKVKVTEFIAETWLHTDVRNYAKKYLADSYFCKGKESVIKYFKDNFST